MRTPKRAFLLRLALACAVVLLGVELGVRWLLFGTSAAARRLGAPLRTPELWADPRAEDEFWKLQGRLADPGSTGPHPRANPELGWMRGDLDPGTLAHPDEARVGARRPVLLFGDSFAECATPPEDCWQGLLERSELGTRYALVNHGTGGYGLDQILICARRVLERWQERDPLVVIGILVDEDLDRSGLTLRNFPKPRFRLEEGELVFEPAPAASVALLLQSHPLAIRSYALRWLFFGSGLPARIRRWIRGEEERIEHMRELNRALLVALEQELDRRGLEHFYMLFHGPTAMHQETPFDWQEPLLYETFAELQAPFVSSRRPLLEALDLQQTFVEHFFMTDGPTPNHYNAEGNAVVFRALRAGFEGRFETAEWMAGAAPHPKARQRTASR